jgi:hypothetical protein
MISLTQTKKSYLKAQSALETMLAGTKCTPIEREFFIRGYLAAVEAILEQQEHDLCASHDRQDQSNHR